MVGAPKCCLRIKGRYYSSWGLWTSSYHSTGALIASPTPSPVDNSRCVNYSRTSSTWNTFKSDTDQREAARAHRAGEGGRNSEEPSEKREKWKCHGDILCPPDTSDIDKRSVLKSRRAQLWWIVIYIRMCCQLAASRVSLPPRDSLKLNRWLGFHLGTTHALKKVRKGKCSGGVTCQETLRTGHSMTRLCHNVSRFLFLA